MSVYDKASLVLIPSGTKTSKVFSQKPVNGDGDFTFSRSTAATRVNADGNIEKETQNLLLQSNSFDTTWINSGTTETSGQAGYDGTNNAWEINKTSAGAYRYIAQIISASGVQTASFYAKAGTLTRVGILVGGGDNPYVSYDLSTGTILAQRASVIDSSITDVGSGWYRCTMTYNVTISDINIYPDWDQTNTGNLYLQDVQLEQGLVARDYIETTTAAVEGGITDNVPRLDYTDSSCPALLLEPQRTNQILYSEYQSGGGFALGPNITWNGFVESPEGVSNASRFTSNVQGFSYVAAQGVVIPSGDFTFSMWVRGVSGTFLNRPLNIAGLSGTSLVYMNEAPVAGEDWKLVYGVGNNTGSAVTKTITLPFYDQPVGSVLEIYGFQLEAGSYATSYIPTYGTSVTRNVDGYNNTTGISGLLGSTTGTFFVDMERFNIEDRDSAGGTFELRSSDGQTELNIDIEASGSTRAFYRDGGSFNFIYQSSVLRGKFCFVYNGANLKLYHNGVKQFDSNALSLQDFSELIYTGVDGAKKHHQIMLFPTALTDQEAIDLTTI